MKKEQNGISTIAIVAIVVTVVVVAVVGVVAAVILLQPGGGGGGGPTTTTTTTPGGMTTTPGITTTTTPGGGIGSATSLACKMDYISENYSGTVTVKVKNLGSDSMKIREEGTIQDQEFIYIINGELQKAWMYSGGVWMDMSEYFSEYWGMSQSLQGEFSEWTGGEITTTDPTTGATIRVYDIELNPVLDDSLFVHSE